MAFADLSIPGVAGVVSTDYSFWSGYRFSVDGTRLKPHGFPRNRLTLPGTAGPVEARVKAGLNRAYPAHVVGDREYATGPETPVALQLLALLPLVTLLVVQGAIGFAVAFGGVFVNLGITRGEQSTGVKVALMVGTFVAAVAIALAAVAAVGSLAGL
jgi:hypothetical protein